MKVRTKDMSRNHIKQLIAINNMLDIVTYLSNEYIEHERKPFNMDNMIKSGIAYKLFCSHMFNIIEAVNKAKYIFGDLPNEYELFQNEINKKYFSNNSKYYEKVNEEMTFFEVLKEMRHELNHFEKGVNDQITMFEIEIKFDDVEAVRVLIQNLIDKKYVLVEYDRRKEIILSRPKIMYEQDRIETVLTNFKENINLIYTNDYCKNDINTMINIYGQIFNPNFIIDLLSEKEEALNIFDSMLLELEMLSKNCDHNILKYGSNDDVQKYIDMKSIIENFYKENDSSGRKEYLDNMQSMFEKIKALYIGQDLDQIDDRN